MGNKPDSNLPAHPKSRRIPIAGSAFSLEAGIKRQQQQDQQREIVNSERRLELERKHAEIAQECYELLIRNPKTHQHFDRVVFNLAERVVQGERWVFEGGWPLSRQPELSEKYAAIGFLVSDLCVIDLMNGVDEICPEMKTGYQVFYQCTMFKAALPSSFLGFWIAVRSDLAKVVPQQPARPSVPSNEETDLEPLTK